MDTFEDIIQAVNDDLNIDSNSPLFPPALVKRAVNRAYRKAGGLFRWPETEDAKKTITLPSQEYYDYPRTWRPNSIWKLKIDGNDYGDPLAFRDYLYERENNIPSNEDYLWSNQWRRYFIYPVPTARGDLAAGTGVIQIWGQKTVSQLVADGDVTIFSYSMPECNEAIAQESVAILKTKGEEEKRAEFVSNAAKQTFVIAWGRIAKEMAKYEKTTPILDVPDFFLKPGTRQNTGKFDV
jgi:hypothetical protein